MTNLRRENQRESSKGFTLFEVALTSLFMAVIAGMTLPNYRAVTEKTRSSEGIQILSAIHQAQTLYILENKGATAGSIANLTSLEIAASTPSFDGPFLFTANGQRAFIDRSNGNYRLYVDTNGNITCDDTLPGPNGWAGICVKMGIATYPF